MAEAGVAPGSDRWMEITGAMNNHWFDLQHGKTILVEGKWIRKSQANGAIIIHVDPRFPSAASDAFARICPGAHVAFLNTIIDPKLGWPAPHAG